MKRLLLILSLCTLCFAQEDIAVHLAATTPLIPSYIKSNNQELAETLSYDISHNGFCQLVPSKNEADLTIIGTLVSEKLYLTIEHKSKGRAFKLGPFTKEREAIHKAHDLISKELFGVRGIASCRIFYTSREMKSKESSKWISNIWRAEYDGRGARQLTNENALIVTPVSIPKAKGHFFYVSYREGEPKIFLGGNRGAKRLTYILGNQLMPAISKQADKIAFISTVHGREDLFVQDFSLEEGVKNKAKKLFSAHFATQGTPTFSPDGSKIAFVSNKDGTARIYCMRVPKEGEGPQSCAPYLLTKCNRGNTAPNWSPDGKKIAYSAVTRGVRQIWIYDIEKNEEEQLTFGALDKENPVWAPNSLHLLYNSASYEKAELYMIDTNQRRPSKICAGPKDKRFPAWEE